MGPFNKSFNIAEVQLKHFDWLMIHNWNQKNQVICGMRCSQEWVHCSEVNRLWFRYSVFIWLFSIHQRLLLFKQEDIWRAKVQCSDNAEVKPAESSAREPSTEQIILVRLGQIKQDRTQLSCLLYLTPQERAHASCYGYTADQLNSSRGNLEYKCGVTEKVSVSQVGKKKKKLLEWLK